MRSLKRQIKEWMSSHKIYQAKMFVGVRYQNVTKLCSPFARCIGSKRFIWMCQSQSLLYLHILRLSLSLANISLQYQLHGTRSRPMDTKKRYFLCFKENFCSGYSLEAALSNINDSFTPSRLMKRPKHFVIRNVMSTQTYIFREIYRKRFNNL